MILAAALAAVAQPGPLAISGDWAAGCDNLRACEAVALSRPRGPRQLALVVQRGAAGSAAAVLQVPLGSAAAGTRWMLAVDGNAVATLMAPGAGGGLALPLSGELLRALLGGREIALVPPRGGTQARASLAGFAAALRHIDTAQVRAGTRGALVQPGTRSDDAVPLPPAPPQVTEALPSAIPARALFQADAMGLVGNAACRLRRGSWRLDVAHSLALSDCGTNAVALLVPDRGSPTRAPFDAEVATGAANWDPQQRRYFIQPSSGCGRSQTFAWDGAQFRLVAQVERLACRGVSAPIVTWRTTVRAAR